MEVLILFALFPSSIHSYIVREHAWEPKWQDSCFDRMKKWKAVAIDPEFIVVGKTLYYPMMGRMDLNRKCAAILRKEVEDLDEASLYYDSCLKVKMIKEDAIRIYGFGNQHVDYWMVEEKVEGQEGYKGRLWRPTYGDDDGSLIQVTLTDNKTFAFYADCTLDNRFSWNVLSTVPELPKETVEAIHKHAIGLGFRKEYFTNIKYDCCK